MGQKVNPHGLRVGIIKDWDSKWYADKDYEKFLLEDIKIREFIKEKLFLSAYHLESQSLIIPTRRPCGLTF